MTTFLKLLRSTSNLEPCTPALFCVMSIWNSTIWKAIILLYTLHPAFYVLRYSPVGISMCMIMYPLHTMDSIGCSIRLHLMYRSNNCSDGYNMHPISQLENPNEPVNIISPSIRIFVLYRNHHCIFLSLRMCYTLLRILAPLQKVQYRFPDWQALLQLNDLIQWSTARV